MTSRRDNINIRGFRAPTLAPALRLPGDYGPWGRWGTDLHGELAVVEQAQRAEQPTAGRDLFSLYARSAARNGRESLPGAASARKGESRSGAAISGVRRGAPCPGGRNQSE